jgi:hypothetical protein
MAVTIIISGFPSLCLNEEFHYYSAIRRFLLIIGLGYLGTTEISNPKIRMWMKGTLGDFMYVYVLIMIAYINSADDAMPFFT